jgi:hypothetical protein
MEQDMSEQHWKIDNGERILMTDEEVAQQIMDPSLRTPEYIANRIGAPESTDQSNTYPNITEQLDLLWHDINSGLLGDKAKTGEFYLKIKSVKDANPKEIT